MSNNEPRHLASKALEQAPILAIYLATVGLFLMFIWKTGERQHGERQATVEVLRQNAVSLDRNTIALDRVLQRLDQTANVPPAPNVEVIRRLATTIESRNEN